MSFDHSCPAEWPISKRKNTVFLAFFGAVAAQKSWLNVFTIVMTTKDTWTTLSLSPLVNGSGCCKFPDQKTSQQQRRFPSTSCRLATYIVVFYRLNSQFLHLWFAGMTEYIPIFSFIKRRNLAVTPVYSYKEYQKCSVSTNTLLKS